MNYYKFKTYKETKKKNSIERYKIKTKNSYNFFIVNA